MAIIQPSSLVTSIPPSIPPSVSPSVSPFLVSPCILFGKRRKPNWWPSARHRRWTTWITPPTRPKQDRRQVLHKQGQLRGLRDLPHRPRPELLLRWTATWPKLCGLCFVFFRRRLRCWASRRRYLHFQEMFFPRSFAILQHLLDFPNVRSRLLVC